MSFLLKAIPSTEKCFMDESIDSKPLLTNDTVLCGEEYHFEVAYCNDDLENQTAKTFLFLDSDSPLPYSIERVEHIPVRFAAYPDRVDDNYLRTAPGLYPNLLLPIDNGSRIPVPYNMLNSLYVTIKVPEDMPAGEYPVHIRLKDVEGNLCGEASVTLRVIPAVLPEQELKFTQWFHCDCIATYYDLEVFSEKHWEYIENFMRHAVDNGINMILTPIFTPPLDTAVGGERPTVQLVDVEKTADGWKFGFEKLERWVALCNKVGAKYFEVAHLFTQWGAGHAPKIIARVDGVEQKVFGWETDSASDEYIGFLRAFLTAFIEKMKSLDNADKRCIFHISDEPGLAHLEKYMLVKSKILDLLQDYPVMDALSNVEFYKNGVITNPIPATNHIEDFLAEKIPDMWTYYCCGQAVDVSNRFFAMSNARTRIIGAQMWKFNIAGFLHWGYNFWYSQYAVSEINPFYVTDGDYFTPAGDCFSVYPGPKGQPYNCLHLKAFTEALHDLRAMKLAESLVGREAVLAAMEEGLEEPITFANYPHEASYVTGLRAKIHALIESKL